MRGKSGHLVRGTGPYFLHWREAELELDITRRRRASSPEKRKKKVGERRKGKQWGRMGWLGSGHADEHGHAYVDKLWVPHTCE